MIKTEGQIVASFLGTLSFAILFDVPKKYSFLCGIIGSIGWAVYLAVFYLNKSSAIAIFAASLCVIYCSRAASFRWKAPVTIFLICGIFCLVPGVAIYHFTYSFIFEDISKLGEYAIAVLKDLIAISFGISLGYELPILK